MDEKIIKNILKTYLENCYDMDRQVDIIYDFFYRLYDKRGLLQILVEKEKKIREDIVYLEERMEICNGLYNENWRLKNKNRYLLNRVKELKKGVNCE